MPWLVSMRMMGDVNGTPRMTMVRRSVMRSSLGLELVLVFWGSASSVSSTRNPAASAPAACLKKERRPRVAQAGNAFESVPIIVSSKYHRTVSLKPACGSPSSALDPLGQEPAIHRNRLAGHKRRSVARQEDRTPHQFIHVAHAPHRRAPDNRGDAHRDIQYLAVQRRAEPNGRGAC